MSLVQAFINQDFILVCGEQRAKLTNGIILENFVKVKKINSNIIIGMTGSIEGNACLFSKFINGDFSLKDNIGKIEYKQAENIIINAFHENLDYIIEKSVHSIICGWDGLNMTGKAFFINENNTYNIYDLTPDYTKQIKFISCGDDLHYKNANELVALIKPSNILQCKNLFMNVIEKGIKFDKGINNNYTFEKIRKVDMLKNVNE